VARVPRRGHAHGQAGHHPQGWSPARRAGLVRARREDIVFNTDATTVKGHSLRRDRRICLCVDDERPPYSFVMVEGTVRVSTDLEDVRRWATIIGGRYMGAERAEEFGARNAVEGELLVRVTPTNVLAVANLAA